MNIDDIRTKVRAKQYFIYDHAFIEAFKDGLSIENLRMELTRPCPNGHTMTLQKINLHFEREGFTADVQDVMAYVCEECGARLIPGATAERVSETVEALFAAALHTETSEPLPPYSRLVFQRASV